METIRCVGRDGEEREFSCSEPDVEGHALRKYTYRIRPLDTEPLESFEFAVQEVSESTAKVVMMNAHNEPAYSAMGIPERMIEACARTLGKTIVSSTNRSNNSDEFRTEPATKVWKRLEQQGLANYDGLEDQFTFCG